jgi:molybdenum cofactor cytidylyltransferase
MKFGPVPIAEAEGAILAHGVAAGPVNFRKGRVLAAADIEALREAKVATVMVARLEDGDVPEDIAARRIGEAARGRNVTLSAAATGRANLHAAERGLVVLDAARVNAINAIHESVTLATLSPFERVEPRQMLATIKIIPFTAPERAVAKAEAIARQAPLIDVAPFKAKKIALVSTTLPGMKASLLDKNRAVTAARAEALGSAIAHDARCAHDAEAVGAAIGEAMRAKPDMLLIFGASATTDRADAVPAGLLAAGGAIDHFGMPVDPGNLLLLGKIGATPVIGLPGCARSPKVNGFDWVLERLCADVPVTAADIMAMGVGGLLKEIPTRPQPRDVAAAKPQRATKVAALVLAAGKSTRMGANKLLMDLHGTPMVARTVAAVAASQADPAIVVTGHDPDAVRAALKSQRVVFAHNPRFAEGMATSLKAGLAALPADIDGVLVCLADMPAVTAAAIDKLIAALNPTEGRAIVVPTYQGKRGNPVLFAAGFIDEMREAHGDAGARALLSAHADAVYEVEMADAGVLADADTPAAFAAIEAEFKS